MAEALRAVEYTAVAKKTGSYTNRASAEAAGGLRQEASATVRVGEARLAVLKSGPATRLVGRPATYLITVRNAGTMSGANKHQRLQPLMRTVAPGRAANLAPARPLRRSPI